MPNKKRHPRLILRPARQIPKGLRIPYLVTERSVRFREGLALVSTIKKIRLIQPEHLLSLLLPNLSEVGGCKDRKITAMRLRAAMKMAGISVKLLDAHLAKVTKTNNAHLAAVPKTKSKIREVRMWVSGEKPIPDKYCPDVASILGVPDAWLHFHKHWNWWEQLSQKLQDRPRNKSERRTRDQSQTDFLKGIIPEWGLPWAEWLADTLLQLSDHQDLKGCWIPMIAEGRLWVVRWEVNNTHC